MTSVTIPNSVKTIGEYAFYGCSSLTSITIPASVTSIGSQMLEKCSRLTSIIIDAKNTKYDSRNNCNGIIETESNTLIAGCQNTIIPNSVKTIGEHAFYGCSGLTSATIPNSVKTIGEYAFYGCSDLTSVTIPNSVKTIGDQAFYECDISEVISMIKNPFDIGRITFNYTTHKNATLYVPIGTIDKYKAKEGWKDFAFIREGIPNSVTEVSARAVRIQSNGGMLTVQGADNGMSICVYSTNGELVGSAVSNNGQATVKTTLQTGNVAIVKVGQQKVKVVVK